MALNSSVRRISARAVGGDEEEADPAAADEEDNPQDELLIEQDIHHCPRRPGG
jgi:hypothetical protein